MRYYYLMQYLLLMTFDVSIPANNTLCSYVRLCTPLFFVGSKMPKYVIHVIS